MTDMATAREEITEIAEKVIARWVDTAYRTILAGLGKDDLGRKVVEEMRHLHLAEPWLPAVKITDAIVAELGLYEEVDSAGRTCLRCDSRWEFPAITESGKAVVESGLTTRQAHEIRTGCSPENRCADCRKWDTWGGDGVGP